MVEDGHHDELIAAAVAVVVAGYLGYNPPGFVSQVVAFAFGLAAASFFPVITLGIFSKRVSTIPAVAGMTGVKKVPLMTIGIAKVHSSLRGLIQLTGRNIIAQHISPVVSKPEIIRFRVPGKAY